VLWLHLQHLPCAECCMVMLAGGGCGWLGRSALNTSTCLICAAVTRVGLLTLMVLLLLLSSRLCATCTYNTANGSST
jgi:hypothetical protein